MVLLLPTHHPQSLVEGILQIKISMLKGNKHEESNELLNRSSGITISPYFIHLHVTEYFQLEWGIYVPLNCPNTLLFHRDSCFMLDED